MSTLDTLYSNSTNKVFIAQNSSTQEIYLIQQKLDNSWYLAQLLQANASNYIPCQMIILQGGQSTWSAL